MRIKVLLELMGCRVTLVHFSQLSEEKELSGYDLVAISYGVPLVLVDQLLTRINNNGIILLAPKAEQGEMLNAFSRLHKICPHAQTIYPFFENKEIRLLLENSLELDTGSPLLLPKLLLLQAGQIDPKITKILKSAHIQTLYSSDAEHALEVVKQEPIDILLCDFVLPQTNGVEVYKRVKALHPRARCILMSRVGKMPDLREAIRCGVDDLLESPVDDSSLLKAIHKLWQNELLERNNQRLVERLQDTIDALIEKDSLLRVIYKNTSAGIMLFKPDGAIIEANDACKALFKLNNDELSGRGFFDLIGKEAADTIRRVCCEGMSVESQSIELQVINAAGVSIPLVASFSEVDYHGTTACAAIFKNVRSLKEKQLMLEEAKELLEVKVRERTQELETAKNLAEAANKSKSEFLANMSHELRTPMHSILSFARFGLDKLAGGESPTDKLEKYFSRIEASGQRLLSLLNDLLDLSKLDVGKFAFEPKEHHLNALISHGIEDTAGTAIEKNIKVHYESPDDEIVLTCDGDKISQIMRNLIGNALKFSHPNSEVFILAARSGDKVIIRVIDNGVGIPQAERELVFEKFAQSSLTNRGAGGTGLGLAICREFVNLHGGKIYASENPTGGTILTVELPLQPAGETTQQAPAHK